MKRSFSPRERWLLTVTPALAIFAVYLFGVYRPQAKLETEAIAKLNAAVAAPVTNAQVAAKRQALRELEDRIDILSRAGTASAVTVAAAPPAEAQTMARITAILAGRDVVVISSARLGEDEAGYILPAGMGEAIKRMPNPASGGVWRLETLAAFSDLCDSLHAIAGQEGLVVPLGISMEPADGGPQHRWSIWIWM